ncbi:MAG: hypothetical protein AMJ46_13050 [Latescibacteria bacterium DG_63]|nr:MAG: hypothetical protein AMJ46_13050 [Latescibacteria bacterium DG_63]
MKSAGIIVAVLFLSMLGCSAAGRTYSYLSPPNAICPDAHGFYVADEVSWATKIFVGKVISVEFLDPRPTEDSFSHVEPRITVTLKVTIPLKQAADEDEVVLHTRWNEWSFSNAARISSCSGYPFEEGREYLVFAYSHSRYSFSSDFDNLPDSALDTSIWAGTRDTTYRGFAEDLKMIRTLLEDNESRKSSIEGGGAD